MKDLPQVTLVAVCGNKYGETIASLRKSLEQINPAKTLLLTNTDISEDGIEVINVGGLKSWEAYNHFIVKEIYKYIETDYFLITQWDSWVLDGNQWDDEFLKYDVIGAKWFYTDGRNVGNGGFKLTTKRLHEILAKDETIQITSPEDEIISRLYRTYLENEYGIKYAPEELADKFAFELHAPVHKTFGFHAFHQQPFQDHIVLRRSGAMGDVLMLEPVINHFVNQGLQVVLDTPVYFMSLFAQYPVPIKHIDGLDPRIKPIRFIDFDMCYEKNPKQLILKSYYEKAGIQNGSIRNSMINMNIATKNKMFKKYAILHIDKTDMPHRNINSIDWKGILMYLKMYNYSVFQVGHGYREEIAETINTPTLEMLTYILAGADLFIGIDSGIAQIAVALNIPSVIFFGSVNPEYRYSNFDKIRVVKNKCDKSGCYHEVISIRGQDCFYNKENPPCTNFSSFEVINKITELI